MTLWEMPGLYFDIDAPGVLGALKGYLNPHDDPQEWQVSVEQQPDPRDRFSQTSVLIIK